MSKTREYKILRAFLNKAIKGSNTDKILESLGAGLKHLVDNVEAVNDQVFIVSSQDKYLDQLLADKNLVRPSEVGLSDEVFAELGIAVSTRKQVRSLIHDILRIMYGDDFVKATAVSGNLEPYSLVDGDSLIISFDESEPVEVFFKTDQFTNISQATAQEVADSINRSLRKIGHQASADAVDFGSGYQVVLYSATLGPSSTIRIYGGRAQNAFLFDTIRPTSASATTQWKLDPVPGNKIRMTWTGGQYPALGKARKGDYINIYAPAFHINNIGTFKIDTIKGSHIVGEAYIEFFNFGGTAETVIQGLDDGVLIYQPFKYNLNTKKTFAAAYQAEPKVLQIFMPATTKVVRRDRKGAAHVQEGYNEGTYGPYVYDLERPFAIGDTGTVTTEQIEDSLIHVTDATEFPLNPGKLVLGFGTDHEEYNVPYLKIPSSNLISIDPSYRFKYNHPIGTDVAIQTHDTPYEPDPDGSDYPFYVTDSVKGRLFAEETIKSVIAQGISVVFIVMYPNSDGLGKTGTDFSEKYEIWG